ncbi:hypothetical protein ADUPG1_009821, partial [Aduncisulcus paluster]
GASLSKEHGDDRVQIHRVDRASPSKESDWKFSGMAPVPVDDQMDTDKGQGPVTPTQSVSEPSFYFEHVSIRDEKDTSEEETAPLVSVDEEDERVVGSEDAEIDISDVSVPLDGDTSDATTVPLATEEDTSDSIVPIDDEEEEEEISAIATADMSPSELLLAQLMSPKYCTERDLDIVADIDCGKLGVVLFPGDGLFDRLNLRERMKRDDILSRKSKDSGTIQAGLDQGIIEPAPSAKKKKKLSDRSSVRLSGTSIMHLEQAKEACIAKFLELGLLGDGKSKGYAVRVTNRTIPSVLVRFDNDDIEIVVEAVHLRIDKVGKKKRMPVCGCGGGGCTVHLRIDKVGKKKRMPVCGCGGGGCSIV